MCVPRNDLRTYLPVSVSACRFLFILSESTKEKKKYEETVPLFSNVQENEDESNEKCGRNVCLDAEESQSVRRKRFQHNLLYFENRKKGQEEKPFCQKQQEKKQIEASSSPASGLHKSTKETTASTSNQHNNESLPREHIQELVKISQSLPLVINALFQSAQTNFENSRFVRSLLLCQFAAVLYCSMGHISVPYTMFRKILRLIVQIFNNIFERNVSTKTNVKLFFQELISHADDISDSKTRVLIESACLLSLGYCISKMKKFEKAKESFERAIALLKRKFTGDEVKQRIYAILLNNLGVAHEKMGNLDEAENILEQALDATSMVEDFETEEERKKESDRAQFNLSRIRRLQRHFTTSSETTAGDVDDEFHPDSIQDQSTRPKDPFVPERSESSTYASSEHIYEEISTKKDQSVINFGAYEDFDPAELVEDLQMIEKEHQGCFPFHFNLSGLLKGFFPKNQLKQSAVGAGPSRNLKQVTNPKLKTGNPDNLDVYECMYPTLGEDQEADDPTDYLSWSSFDEESDFDSGDDEESPPDKPFSDEVYKESDSQSTKFLLEQQDHPSTNTDSQSSSSDTSKGVSDRVYRPLVFPPGEKPVYARGGSDSAYSTHKTLSSAYSCPTIRQNVPDGPEDSPQQVYDATSFQGYIAASYESDREEDYAYSTHKTLSSADSCKTIGQNVPDGPEDSPQEFYEETSFQGYNAASYESDREEEGSPQTENNQLSDEFPGYEPIEGSITTSQEELVADQDKILSGQHGIKAEKNKKKSTTSAIKRGQATKEKQPSGLFCLPSVSRLFGRGSSFRRKGKKKICRVSEADVYSPCPATKFPESPNPRAKDGYEVPKCSHPLEVDYMKPQNLETYDDCGTPTPSQSPSLRSVNSESCNSVYSLKERADSVLSLPKSEKAALTAAQSSSVLSANSERTDARIFLNKVKLHKMLKSHNYSEAIPFLEEQLKTGQCDIIDTKMAIVECCLRSGQDKRVLGCIADIEQDIMKLPTTDFDTDAALDMYMDKSNLYTMIILKCLSNLYIRQHISACDAVSGIKNCALRMGQTVRVMVDEGMVMREISDKFGMIFMREMIECLGQVENANVDEQTEAEATCLNEMGLCLQNLDHYDEAVKTYREAIQIIQDRFSANRAHSILGDLYNNLGISYTNLQKYNHAWTSHLQSIHSYKEAKKYDDPDEVMKRMVITRENLKSVNSFLKRRPIAIPNKYCAIKG